MATVIDALVLELGLDSKKFTKGQQDALASLRKFQEASVAGGKEIESQGKKTEKFFTDLKRGALEIASVFLGGRGLREFVTYLADLDANIGRTSKTIGVGIRDLSAWQGAIELAGGSAASITATIGGMRNAMEGFLAGKGGGDSFLPLLARYGVAFQELNGNIRNGGEIVLDLVEAMKREGAQLPTIAALLRDLPGMNEESINLLIRGRNAVHGLLDEARQAGVTTRESAELAAEYQKQLKLLDRSATDAGRSLGIVLAPGAISAAKEMTSLIASLRQLQGLLREGEWKAGWIELLSLISRIKDDLLSLAPLLSPGAYLADKVTGLIPGAKVQSWKDRIDAAGKRRSPTSWHGAAAIPPASMTRGDRNNNPGNIEHGPFAIAHGATGSDGRFAIFPTKEMGEKAMADLLASKYQGLTLAEIQRKWVGNEDRGYLDSMMRSTGMQANSVPNLQDPTTRQRLIRGMARGEGSHLSVPTPGAPAAAAASSPITNDNSRGDTTVTNSTQYGTIIIHSESGDGAKIARDFTTELDRNRRIGIAAMGGAN